MNHYIAIAIGGAMGSVLRFWLSNNIHHRLQSGFPVGTLMVNVVGSFLIGLVFVILQQRFPGDVQGNITANSNELIRGFLVVGLLGGFTTFSTFSLETVHLIQSGSWLKGVSNALISVFICVFSAFAGLQIGRLIYTN